MPFHHTACRAHLPTGSAPGINLTLLGFPLALVRSRQQHLSREPASGSGLWMWITSPHLTLVSRAPVLSVLQLRETEAEGLTLGGLPLAGTPEVMWPPWGGPRCWRTTVLRRVLCLGCSEGPPSAWSLTEHESRSFPATSGYRAATSLSLLQHKHHFSLVFSFPVTLSRLPPAQGPSRRGRSWAVLPSAVTRCPGQASGSSLPARMTAPGTA